MHCVDAGGPQLGPWSFSVTVTYFNYFSLFYRYTCFPCVHIYSSCVYAWCLQRQKRGPLELVLEMVRCGCWELNLGLLEEQQGFLITGPSLRLPMRDFRHWGALALHPSQDPGTTSGWYKRQD